MGILIAGLLSLLTLKASPVQGFEPMITHFRVEVGDLVRGTVCLQVESEEYYRQSCWVADGRILIYLMDYVLPAGDFQADLYAVTDGKISYKARPVTLHVEGHGGDDFGISFASNHSIITRNRPVSHLKEH